MSVFDDAVAAAQEAKIEGDALAAENENLRGQLDAKDATIADLSRRLAECETEPEPEPTPTGTAWGMGSFRVLDSTDPMLDAYRGKTQFEIFEMLQTEFSGMNGGRRMTSHRVYDSGFPTTFADHDAADVASGIVPVASVKANDSDVASGSLDARIRGFVVSWPAAVRGYLILNHERDNDSDALANPAAVMAVHRRALARFAKVVLDNRGTKDLVPACCPTGWNLQDQNTSYPRDVLNPRAELEAAGVPLDEFVFAYDSYNRNPDRRTFEEIVGGIEGRVRGWGFSRTGLGEVAVDSSTSANRALAAGHIDDLAAIVEREGMDFVCWYESSGGNKAPAQGWWIYGSAPKTAWANAL